MLASWKVCCVKLQQRWILAFMGCLAAMNAVMMRNCLSVAITAMVVTTGTSNGTTLDDTCPASKSTPSRSSPSSTHEWTEYTQGIILSSYFWGYMVAQLPGGMIVAKFGSKYPLGIGLLVAGVLTLLTPTVVEAYDAKGLMILRILIGLSSGAIYSSFSSLTAHWASPPERSKIGSVIMSGSLLGTVIANALSGVLIENFSIGWPIVFYFFGGFSVLWFCAWTLLCYSRPEVHPFITDVEKNHLKETIEKHDTGKNREKQPIPWRYILSSPPFWALISVSMSHDWSSHMMATDLPKYMSNVLKFPVQSNGLISALPFMAKWVVGNVSAWFADWLIKREKISRRNARKTFATISGLGVVFILIGALDTDCDQILVVVLFILGMGVTGNMYPGIMVNHVDLSPNHAGTMMGFTNMITSTAGIAAPYAVGVLTPNQTRLEWRIVFWITFVLSFVTILIFDIWGDGDVQPWNDLDSIDRKQKEVENGKRKDGQRISSS